MTKEKKPMRPEPPPSGDRHSDVDRRRVLTWIGGIGLAGYVGAILTPLKDLNATRSGLPGDTDPLIGQRLVYSHREDDELAIGGHTHDETLFVRADDFGGQFTLDGVLVYPEGLVNAPSYGILLHNLEPDELAPPTDFTLTDQGFVAYSAVCPNCGTLLNWSDQAGETGQGVDRCPAHGSQFNPYRGGEPAAGPATDTLPQVGVIVNSDGILELTTGLRERTYRT